MSTVRDISDRLFNLLRRLRDQGDAEAADLLAALSGPERYAKSVKHRQGRKDRRPRTKGPKP